MKTSKKNFSRIVATFVVVLLIWSGIGVAEIQAARKSGTSNRSGSAPAVTNTVVDGEIGPGALYRLVKPDNWNGGLVLFAHGSLLRTAPIALPPIDGLTAEITARGYAFAYSSFAENGFAVKDGAKRTHQLVGIFTSKFGVPTRVYITGKSMGGLIAIKLAEQFPDQFAGTLAACATAGGTRLQFDYHANVRALFDVFYPGVLPGDAVTMAPDTDLITQLRNPALAAMTADMSGAYKMAAIDQTPLPWSNAAQLRTAIATSLNTNAVASIDYFPEELQGRSKFGNSDTLYTSPTLAPDILADVNTNIGRYLAAPSALNYMENYYNPTGNLHMPTIEIATTLDPNVPVFHHIAFANRVAAAGKSNLLYQIMLPRFGHCNFTDAEFGSAFDALTQWVEEDTAPAP